MPGAAGSRGGRLDGLNIYFNQLEEHVEYSRWFFGCQHLDKALSRRHRAVFRDVVPVRETPKPDMTSRTNGEAGRRAD